MRVDEFLESNMIRSFPFVDTYGSPVPDWLIVDFRATILAGTFDPSIHSVYLAWMARLSNKVRFGFRTDAPELADQELIFELDMSSDKMVTQHVYLAISLPKDTNGWYRHFRLGCRWDDVDGYCTWSIAMRRYPVSGERETSI
jgi:hypothetical protein